MAGLEEVQIWVTSFINDPFKILINDSFEQQAVIAIARTMQYTVFAIKILALFSECKNVLSKAKTQSFFLFSMVYLVLSYLHL